MLSSIRSVGRLAMTSGSRTMSNVSSQNRLNIAQGLLRAKAIRASKDEAAVKAASSSAPAIDAHHLPAELSEFSNYLVSGGAQASAPFVPDPNAWQNKVWYQFMYEEYTRPFQKHIFIFGTL